MQQNLIEIIAKKSKIWSAFASLNLTFPNEFEFWIILMESIYKQRKFYDLKTT